MSVKFEQRITFDEVERKQGSLHGFFLLLVDSTKCCNKVVSCSCGGLPCPASNGLFAALAFPDADGLPSDGILSAELACIASMLGNFNLLNNLSQGSTVSCTVFADNSDFLCALCHRLRSEPYLLIQLMIPCVFTHRGM